MTATVFEISKSATFDAAHRLQGGPANGSYTRLHGHSFQVEATLRGPATAPLGWVDDIGELDTALRAAAADLDHSMLNEHPGLENPTLEALCLWFAGRLGAAFPKLHRIMVSRPTVGERCAIQISNDHSG